jgi:hypothetical protein
LKGVQNGGVQEFRIPSSRRILTPLEESATEINDEWGIVTLDP